MKLTVISSFALFTLLLLPTIHCHLDGYTDAAKQDHVPSLPGWGKVDHFDLFSGYVTVNEDAGRALFYVLAESSSETKDTDPLILWLNGGPGCSSLGGGFLSELGPFYPTPSGKLIRDNFDWNSIANMLFLESPAFVGFSYSNTSDDAVVGDERTAKDALAFLLGFMEKFPQYKDRPLMLSGESYAGHYVPQLALEILKHNEKENVEKLNFEGFLVGNALTDPVRDSEGALNFWLSHGITSFESYYGIKENCEFEKIYPLASAVLQAKNKGYITTTTATSAPVEEASVEVQGEATTAATTTTSRKLQWKPTTTTTGTDTDSILSVKEPALEGKRQKQAKCDEFLQQSSEEFGGINIYDIYVDVCMPTSVTGPIHQLTRMLYGSKNSDMTTTDTSTTTNKNNLSTTTNARGDDDITNQNSQNINDEPAPPGYDPCIDNEVEIYLNRPEVQAALHANTTGSLPGPWTTCTQKIQYSTADILSSVIPVWEELLKKDGIRMLVYSGDVDAIVPIIGTRRWMEDLGLDVTEKWRPWIVPSTRQVGGWTEKYDRGLMFASIRGAGHMTPYTQGQRSFHMFKRFVKNEPL